MMMPSEFQLPLPIFQSFLSLTLPVISSGLISASNSRVMRVTSLLGELRARRPLPFFDESHFRFTKDTWQSEQGADPPSRINVSIL